MGRLSPSLRCILVVLATVVAPAAARASLPEIVDRAAGSVVSLEVAPAGARAAGGHRFGAGWVFDPAGHIVSSAKLVGGASSVVVRLQDGRQLPARVLGTDAAFDLAVLDAGARLPALPIGRGDLARLGESVSAITRTADGNVVVRAGILSARGGTGAPLLDDDLLPDPALDGSFVGAPLLDGAGRALGLVALRAPARPATAPRRALGAAAFARLGSASEPPLAAVPVDVVSEAVRQILDGGHVQWPWLGLGLRTAADNRLEVASTEPASPAAGADLAPGDVVVSLQGRRVRSIADVQRIVLTHRVGSSMALVTSRGGATRSVDVVTQAHPGPPVP